jgi:Ca2+-binding EF-hand superfamily protein
MQFGNVPGHVTARLRTPRHDEQARGADTCEPRLTEAQAKFTRPPRYKHGSVRPATPAAGGELSAAERLKIGLANNHTRQANENRTIEPRVAAILAHLEFLMRHRHLRIIDMCRATDRSDDGSFDAAAIHKMLNKFGIPVTTKEVGRLMSYLETDQSGNVQASSLVKVVREERNQRDHRTEVKRGKAYTDFVSQLVGALRERARRVQLSLKAVLHQLFQHAEQSTHRRAISRGELLLCMKRELGLVMTHEQEQTFFGLLGINTTVDHSSVTYDAWMKTMLDVCAVQQQSTHTDMDRLDELVPDKAGTIAGPGGVGQEDFGCGQDLGSAATQPKPPCPGGEPGAAGGQAGWNWSTGTEPDHVPMPPLEAVLAIARRKLDQREGTPGDKRHALLRAFREADSTGSGSLPIQAVARIAGRHLEIKLDEGGWRRLLVEYASGAHRQTAHRECQDSAARCARAAAAAGLARQTHAGAQKQLQKMYREEGISAAFIRNVVERSAPIPGDETQLKMYVTPSLTPSRPGSELQAARVVCPHLPAPALESRQ